MYRYRLLMFLSTMVLCISALADVKCEIPRANDINWQVISSGGTYGSSADYDLSGTAGQTAVDYGESEIYRLYHGFWQMFCRGMCGDANADSLVNVSDAVYIINYVFVGGEQPKPVLACGDANSDCDVNVSDAVYIINYVFVGGSAPGDCCPSKWDGRGGDCCPFEE